MADGTAISWTDATWNPVRGCSRVSEGCRNCYAERVAARFCDEGQPYHGIADRERKGSKWTGDVRMVPEHLADPLRWKRPRRIFVNSMSDLFHEKLTNEQIAAVFGVMAAAPRHTFQVLTKRAHRMRWWFEWARGPFTEQQRGIVSAPNTTRALLDAAFEFLGAAWKPRLDAIWRSDALEADAWPPPNIWLGVSVENQAAADERIPELLRTPAAVRFLSCEPLLGETDVRPYVSVGDYMTCPCCRYSTNIDDEDTCPNCGAIDLVPDFGIDWVIAGCESGPGARPCSVEWLRSLRDQCAAAGVPYFLKQAEESADCGEDRQLDIGDDESIAHGVGSKMKARRPGGNHVIELPYLDGVQHAAFPESMP